MSAQKVTSTGQMRINLPGVIKMLGESLYSDPSVAIRELIQNANDTCIVRKAVDPNAPPPEIKIDFNAWDHILIVEDNGAGLTAKEVEEFLTVIGRSHTDEVRRWLEEEGQLPLAERLIGRFGLGLLSAFMIADRIEFDTLSYQAGAEPIWWACAGGQEYETGPGTKKEPGTRVTIKVDAKHIGLLNEERLTELIRLYADLLSVPIYLGYSRTPVNTMTAPWHRAWEGEVVPEAEYREFARRRFQDVGILDVIPVSIVEDEGRFKVGGVLVIPKQPLAIVREHGDAIVYVRRMFVCKDDRTVLPEWAKFVKGIVESPNLRETTSRESVRRDENLLRVQQALGRHILEWLAKKSEDDPRMFREIVTNHNLVIKAWALVSDELFDRIKDIVLFDTDVGYMNLPRYFEQSRLIRKGREEEAEEIEITDEKTGERKKASKRYIYYFATPGGVGQHAFLFQARGVRVIDAQFFPEESFLKKYAERHPDVELRRLDVGGEYIFEELRPKDARWVELEEAYADRRIEARVVRYEPASIPAVLIFPEAPSYEQQARQLLDDPEVSPALKNLLRPLMEELDKGRKQKISGAGVLYLNADNEVIQQLAEEYPRREEVEEVDVLTTIYNNALMLSAPRSLTLENARRIFDSNNRTIRALINKINEVRELRQRAKAADPAHMQQLEAEIQRLQAEIRRLEEENQRLSLFAPVFPAIRTACFARPYRPEFADIEDSVKRIFIRELGIRLETVAEKPGDLVVFQSIQTKIRNSHLLVADITGANPNVLIEVGYALGAGKPVILIQRQDDDTPIPFDVQPFLRFPYAVLQAPDGRKVVVLLADELERAKDAIFEKTPGLREASPATGR